MPETYPGASTSVSKLLDGDHSHGDIVFLFFNFVYFPRGHKVPILTMITASILSTLDKDHIISLEMLVSPMKLTY